MNVEALFKLTYGLFIVSSGDRNEGNGFISNTVFQVSSDPPLFAACCNKNNYTSVFIKKYKAFSVSILQKDAPPLLFGTFGFRSGKDFDKMKGMNIIYGSTGVPVILNESVAYLECKLTDTFDVGTHLIFIGELLNAEIIDNSKEPLTYSYYRQVKKGIAPENAPTYIDKSQLEKKTMETYRKFKCPACGHIYDEAIEKVKFSELPDTWVCPVCGMEKKEFIETDK